MLVVCFSTYSQKVNLNRCISSNFRLETLALVRCEANEVKIKALLPDQKGCHASRLVNRDLFDMATSFQETGLPVQLHLLFLALVPKIRKMS